MSNMTRHLVDELGLQGVTGEFHTANETDLGRIQKELKAQLPKDYLHFLRDYGASLFSNDAIFTPVEPSPWAVNGQECFDVFYGASEDQDFDICSVNSRLENDIPPGTIAIGHDSGSNLILLSWKNGEVRFFDKDTGNTYLIATSFDAFLKSFRFRQI